MSNITSGFLDVSLGRYKIGNRLGSGGMASVFKAQDTTLERPVAIKVLHEHLTDDPAFKDRFIQEAKLVAGLNHPNIIQIYDFDAVEYQDRRIFYMVMPYLPGKTLADVIDNYRAEMGYVPHEKVLSIIRDLSAALNYAHLKGMVHRDVKPANVIFDEHDHAILTDFGIARLAERSRLTQEGITIGTPVYMSPEQATGGQVDGRSDIYALGIILYEMLTGQTPFEDDGTLSILLKHVNAPIPRISEFAHIEDRNLDTVVFHALAKDPDARYPSAEAFASDLEAVFHGKKPGAPVSRSKPSTIATQLIEIPTAEGDTQSSKRTTGSQLLTALQQVPRPRSAAGILSLGLSLIVIVLVLGIISQQQVLNTLAPAAASTTDSSSKIIDSMTGNLYFVSTFDTDDPYVAAWPASDTGVMERQITEGGFYQLTNREAGTAATTLFEEAYSYADAVIEMTASLQEDQPLASGYGIVFRYNNAENYNVFAVDGRGRYSIWALKNGDWMELRGLAGENWTPHNSVKPAGDWNDLRILIYGNQLAGYVNGEEVVSLSDDSFSEGGIGIYIGTTPGGEATLLVDTFKVSEPEVFTNSMTGEDADLQDSMTGQ